nr:MAG TPA_asm: hypothetical protein [Caudoviricetes sp.]
MVNKNRQPETAGDYAGVTDLPASAVSYTGVSPGHKVCHRQIPLKVGGGPFRPHISASMQIYIVFQYPAK